MHFEWEVTSTHGTQPNTFLYGAGGRIATSFKIKLLLFIFGVCENNSKNYESLSLTKVMMVRTWFKILQERLFEDENLLFWNQYRKISTVNSGGKKLKGIKKRVYRNEIKAYITCFLISV